MPPQACARSPASSCFRPGGEGEWSVPIVSIMPSRSPSQSRSRFVAHADRRGTFEAGVAVGYLLGGEREVVRARLDRQRQPLRAGLGNQGHGSAVARWTMWTRHPVSRQSPITSRIASTSHASGRDASQAR